MRSTINRLGLALGLIAYMASATGVTLGVHRHFSHAGDHHHVHHHAHHHQNTGNSEHHDHHDSSGQHPDNDCKTCHQLVAASKCIAGETIRIAWVSFEQAWTPTGEPTVSTRRASLEVISPRAPPAS